MSEYTFREKQIIIEEKIKFVKSMQSQNLSLNHYLEILEENLQQHLELESHYCEECEACGEEGCCKPKKCTVVECKYGPTYINDFDFAIAFANAIHEKFSDNDEINVIWDQEYDKIYSK